MNTLSGGRDGLLTMGRMDIPRPRFNNMEFVPTRGKRGIYMSIRRNGAEFGLQVPKMGPRRPMLSDDLFRRPSEPTGYDAAPTQAHQSGQHQSHQSHQSREPAYSPPSLSAYSNTTYSRPLQSVSKPSLSTVYSDGNSSGRSSQSSDYHSSPRSSPVDECPPDYPDDYVPRHEQTSTSTTTTRSLGTASQPKEYKEYKEYGHPAERRQQADRRDSAAPPSESIAPLARNAPPPPPLPANRTSAPRLPTTGYMDGPANSRVAALRNQFQEPSSVPSNPQNCPDSGTLKPRMGVPRLDSRGKPRTIGL